LAERAFGEVQTWGGDFLPACLKPPPWRAPPPNTRRLAVAGGGPSRNKGRFDDGEGRCIAGGRKGEALILELKKKGLREEAITITKKKPDSKKDGSGKERGNQSKAADEMPVGKKGDRCLAHEGTSPREGRLEDPARKRRKERLRARKGDEEAETPPSSRRKDRLRKVMKRPGRASPRRPAPPSHLKKKSSPKKRKASAPARKEAIRSGEGLG